MKILLLSDTHITATRTICNDNLETIKSFLKDDDIDFAIHLGDVTADGATFPEQLDCAAESFRDFGVPVHFVPGNHDVGDNPIAPGRINDLAFHLNDARFSAERLARYCSVFGPDHWSVDLPGWQLIGLDAQLFATDSAAEAEQAAWLDKVLSTGTGSVAVFLHKPFFRNGHADTDAHIRYVPHERRRPLVDLLSTRPLKLVCSGHVHQDRQIFVDGVEHNWVPSASFCMPDEMQERIGSKTVGIRLLELHSDGLYEMQTPVVPGLRLHNVVHHPEIDPRMTTLGLELGARAEL